MADLMMVTNFREPNIRRVVWVLALLIAAGSPRGGAAADPLRAPVSTSEPSRSLASIALAEMQSLDTALFFAYLDNNWFIVPEALNDLDYDSVNDYDEITDMGGMFVINPAKGVFEPTRRNLQFTWFGPYANYQPGKTQTAMTPYDLGSPLDPWGSPYLFFSPLGLLRGDTGAVTMEYYADAFDRYTYVSLGPDGVMSGDDVIRQIGATVSTISTMSAGSVRATASGPPVTIHNTINGSTFETTEEAPIRIRGYYFGATQGASTVRFGAVILGAVTSWSPSDIELVLPSGLTGSGSLRVHVGGGISNPLTLTIRTPDPTPTATAPASATPTPAATTTPTATPAPCCFGDADNSAGLVDAADFIAVQGAFGAESAPGGPGDGDCSGGFVDANDFIAVQAAFGADCD